MCILHELVKHISGIGLIPSEREVFIGENKGKVDVVELGEVEVGPGCPVDVVGHHERLDLRMRDYIRRL